MRAALSIAALHFSSRAALVQRSPSSKKGCASSKKRSPFVKEGLRLLELAQPFFHKRALFELAQPFKHRRVALVQTSAALQVRRAALV